jgi:hypothetical protein
MAKRILVALLGAAVAVAIPFGGNAQQTKKEAAPAIKGGIEGKVKKVDHEKSTLTITTVEGKERTFEITDDTTMVGPRGGLVRRGLKDPRFHEGMELTIVAKGATATEVHLGFSRHTEGAASTKTTKERPSTTTTDKSSTKTTEAKSAAKDKVKAAAHEEEDEDIEMPGKVKSVDPAKHMLVITLLNGKDHSFMIAKETPVLVKGAASKRGLEDPALKVGAKVHVVTDAEGHKVKEVKVDPVLVKSKKAA